MKNHLLVPKTEVLDDVENSTNVLNKSDEESFSFLLNYFVPIDFYSRAKLVSGQKLTTKHYVVLTIDELLAKLKTNKLGMASFNGQVYIFKGEYWQILTKEELKNFLGCLSFRLGIEVCTSKYHSFKDELHKQFVTSSFVKITKEKTSSLINFRNGTLVIGSDGSLVLKDFDKHDFLTFQLPFVYDEGQDCPLFMKFLNKVLPDIDQQNIIAEFIAYSLLPNSLLKLEKSLILYGVGSNGKSVVFDLIINLLGKDNVSNYTLQSITNETGYQRAMLAHRLLNYASEISSRMDSTMFKALVSGEAVECRLPYQEPMIIDEYAKLMFNCNQLPADVEHNNAFYRRFLIIEFAVVINEEEKDPQLAQKIILDELPGLFNWVLEGMKRLLKNKKFTYSKKSEDLLKDYQLQSDSVKLFLADEKYSPCILGDMALKYLYQTYRNYCLDSGYKPCSNRIFADRLRKIGFGIERKNIGMIVHACNDQVIN